MLDNGFLIVWNDVNEAFETEYRRWHRIEHMPERLAVPGFTLGRRFTDFGSASSRFLTIYEVSSPAIFESAAYRRSLAAPTPDTKRMSAEMFNFVRRVCRTVATDGIAIGGAVATFRLNIPVEKLDTIAAQLVAAAMEIEPLVAAHVGAVDAERTGLRQDDMQTRAAAPDFDAVLIVEADGRASLHSELATLQSLIERVCGEAPSATHVHDLALTYRPAPAGASVAVQAPV